MPPYSPPCHASNRTQVIDNQIRVCVLNRTENSINKFTATLFGLSVLPCTMQSEEQTIVKVCRYCGKEFKAWKPSLKYCGDLCRQNANFDADLSLLGFWDKFNKKLQAEIKQENNQPKQNQSPAIVAPVKRIPKNYKAANRLKRLFCHKPLSTAKAKV